MIKPASILTGHVQSCASILSRADTAPRSSRSSWLLLTYALSSQVSVARKLTTRQGGSRYSIRVYISGHRRVYGVAEHGKPPYGSPRRLVRSIVRDSWAKNGPSGLAGRHGEETNKESPVLTAFWENPQRCSLEMPQAGGRLHSFRAVQAAPKLGMLL